ncbi:Protein of unknown function [Gryllus bimaculatus]|nr:Protein of unknown function [Gryllus bimaculatus]
MGASSRKPLRQSLHTRREGQRPGAHVLVTDATTLSLACARHWQRRTTVTSPVRRERSPLPHNRSPEHTSCALPGPPLALLPPLPGSGSAPTRSQWQTEIQNAVMTRGAPRKEAVFWVIPRTHFFFFYLFSQTRKVH